MAWPSTLVRTKNWGSEVLTDSDLESQFDLIINYVVAMMDATSGHKHTGSANDGTKIDLTTGVTGSLPVGNGGTGVASLAALLSSVYPIGSVYINVSDSTSPTTLLGFGTWAALGAGRMIVGYDSSDTSFDSAGETGGSNTVTLTTTELPAHTHTIAMDNGGSVSAASALGRSGSALANQTTSSAGTGAAFSVLNKYVTCFTWRRTA